MRKKIAVVAAAGGVALTGGLLMVPGVASAADVVSPSSSVGDRLSAIKDALKGLVADKTLTQEQADKVAATLDGKLPRRGPGMGMGHRGGGPGMAGARLGPEEVAKVLGITPAELRTQLQAGKTLAQIAQAEGISKATLIADLVKAAEARLAQAVKNGRLTQAQADQIRSTLKARITEKVDEVHPGPGPGHRHHHHFGPPPAGTAPQETPGTDAEPSSVQT